MTRTHPLLPCGSLEVICGPMFSGKSEELIRRLRRAYIAKQNVLVFKHSFDNRGSSNTVRSHNGTLLEAFPTSSLEYIRNTIHHCAATVIGIDEVQFYSMEIIPLLHTLIEEGKRVIVGGLDLDFRGIPFGPMPILLAIADKVTKLCAICTLCGQDAFFSQRLVNNVPAKFDDPLIQIGAQEAYQARCRTCYHIDKKPVFNLTGTHG